MRYMCYLDELMNILKDSVGARLCGLTMFDTLNFKVDPASNWVLCPSSGAIITKRLLP